MRDQVFERAVLLQPLRGGLRPDAGNAGDVIDGIADECLIIDDLLGGDAPIADQPLAVHRFVFAQVQNRHAVADQLTAIFVAGAKVNFVTAFGGVGGHGRHHIVGFVTGLHEDRHAQRFEHLMDQRFLCDQFFWGRRAVGFILRVDRFAEGRVFVVEHGEEVIGPMIVEIHDRATDAEHGIRRAAIGGVHRRYPVEHLKDHPVRV